MHLHGLFVLSVQLGRKLLEHLEEGKVLLPLLLLLLRPRLLLVHLQGKLDPVLNATAHFQMLLGPSNLFT
jgi:hypothetical protein